MKELNTVEQFKEQLIEALNNGDQEQAHMDADSVLIRAALNTTLTLDERREIVDIYIKVEKWFA